MLGRSCFVALLALACASGCGSSDDGGSSSGGAGGAAGAGGSAGSGGSGAGSSIPFACPGGTVVQDLNDGFTVGSAQRKFYADFPADTSKPMAVIFSWHGYGDTAANFRFLGLNPDADPSFPFVVITPESTGLFPPAGLDWAIFQGATSDANADADLFEGVLGCLNEQYAIDPTRIYSVGFSAGAIFTNLLHSRYPKLLAATLDYSGAWFDDPAETANVNTIGFNVTFSWNPLDAADHGAVLMTHGGANDSFGFGTTKVIDFEQEAQAALPFLTNAGRVVIDCAHSNGHQPAPDVGPAVAQKFLAAHQLGQPSPLLTEFSGYPSSCTLHTP
jgi:predicted esterase